MQDREKTYEQFGLTQGENTPGPAPLPQKLSDEDVGVAAAFQDDPEGLQTLYPEEAQRIADYNQGMGKHFLESLDAELRKGPYYEKFNWGNQGHVAVAEKLTSEVLSDPEKRAQFVQDNDYNYRSLATHVVSELAPAVAKERGFAPAETVTEYIHGRNEKLAAQRGFGSDPSCGLSESYNNRGSR